MKNNDYVSYVLQNSEMYTLHDAVKIVSKFIRFENGKFTFRCIVDRNNLYAVILRVDSDRRIKSSRCACHEQKVRLCQHKIASIWELNKIIKNKTFIFPHQFSSVSIENDPLNNTRRNEWSLAGGIIDLDRIIDKNEHLRGFYHLSIEDISVLNRVITKVYGWSAPIQIFNYYPEREKLSFECNCNGRNRSDICEHILHGIQKIVQVYGADFFAPNYKERVATEHLAQYGIEVGPNYEPYVEIKTALNGTQIVEKVKNIRNADQNLDIFESEEDELWAQIPALQEEKTSHGLTFCFATDRKEFLYFLPTIAKYNKARTKLSSSFRTLTFPDLTDQLPIVDADEQMVIDGVKLDRILDQSILDNDFSKLKQAISLQEKMLPQLMETPLYAYNERHSLILKNLVPIRIENH